MKTGRRGDGGHEWAKRVLVPFILPSPCTGCSPAPAPPRLWFRRPPQTSRVITRALDRERRHEMAVQDAAIYAESGEDPDMADLVQYLSGHPADPDQ